ncbi:MAG: hypothetical protein CFH37_00046, partial [Alphaproteobacteria bacterium MarineAlpha9_Bin7]
LGRDLNALQAYIRARARIGGKKP